jgi:hypothetical protein
MVGLVLGIIFIIIGVIINNVQVYSSNGDPLLFLGIIFSLIGVIRLIVRRVREGTWISSSSSSSNRPSMGSVMSNWAESRKNDPHTCSNCRMYLSQGVCRRDDSPKSPGDFCSNWD